MNMKISKQRAWQLKHKANGLCVYCSRPKVTNNHCAIHRDKHNVMTKKWYEINKDWHRAYRKEWLKRNPDYMRQYYLQHKSAKQTKASGGQNGKNVQRAVSATN